MFEDIAKSLKAALYERTTSPLLGSFFIFWLYLNWRGISILFFGTDSIDDRIISIEQSYIDTWINFWCPLIYAIIFSVIYPYVSVLPYFILKHANSLKIRIKNKIENITTIPIDEYHNIKKDIYEKDGEISKLIEKKTLREESLISQVEILEKQNNEINSILKEKNEANQKYNIFQGKNKGRAILLLKNVISDLTVQLQDSRVDSFSYFCKKSLESVVKTNSIEQEKLRLLEAWLFSISNRVNNDAYVNLIDELSDYIRAFVHVADVLRTDLKISIKNENFETKYSDEQKKVIISDIKENWDIVRIGINSIVDSWKKLITSEYMQTPIVDKDIFFELLKHIE